ncbi:MAG: tautomerase family protein [Streptococcaceae bacterium]|jgi:4-oxalocrotonate tautomerase|nr:tautomerase family protein [Streptococcaceae bacterium]
MPFITVDLFEGRTVEAKQAMAKEITETVMKHTKAPADAIHVIFKDMKEGDYYPAGEMKTK